MSKIKKLFINIDGACRNNPGLGAIGIVIKDNGNTLQEHCEFIGETTNNRAEYTAAIKGLELAMSHCRDDIYILSDSELLIKQLNGVYRVKNSELRKLLIKIKQLEIFFKKVSYSHIKRDKNVKADQLANKALDDRLGS